MNRKAILFSGYAQLPSGTVSSELYRVMALVLLIDVRTGTIIEAECTLSTPLAERFVSQLLVGKSIQNGPHELIELINEVYQGSARKAIITALRIVYGKYLEFLQLNPPVIQGDNKFSKTDKKDP